jgi:hypothetical protein
VNKSSAAIQTPNTEVSGKPASGGAPFQFSIRQMFLLTTVCALAAGFAGSIGAPTICRVVLAFYLMSMAAYVVLRLPFICRELMKLQTRRERIRVHRKELEAMIRERRQKTAKGGISEDGDLPGSDPPRRPVQFTVRTFFGAAFLISLFGAAAKLPSVEAKIIAITFLAWLTAAGLYWTLGATGPLLALPVGTVVLGVVWGMTLVFVMLSDLQGLGVWVAVPIAFGWGIVFSIIVVLSRALGYVSRRVRSRLWGESKQRPILSAWEVARQVLFTRLLLSVLLVIGAILSAWYPLWPNRDFDIISLLIDMPLAPIVIGFLYPSPPDSSLVFILVTALLYCPLYAGTGWMLGFILARMSRRTSPDANPGDMNRDEKQVENAADAANGG